MTTFPNFLSSVTAVVLLILTVGCADNVPVADTERGGEVDQKPEQPAGGGAVIKTTDDIQEYKPEEGKEIVDSKVRVTNPITAPLEAYEPMKQKIAQDIQVQHAVRLFQAMEGRYPKDYDEFMEKVIRANNIRLPRLGPTKQYQYDVKNHQLVVVRVAPEEK